MVEEKSHTMSGGALLGGMFAIMMIASACSKESESSLAGEAALATAQFWQQEMAAGTLPEGTVVEERGTRAVVDLDLPEDVMKGTLGRFCVEFQYIRASTPFDLHTRVYISTLVDKAWVVVMEKPDGTCEGVS